MTPAGYRIEAMREEDIPGVAALEARALPAPWSPASFRHELRDNPHACCYVVRTQGEPVVAYACVWLLEDELLINTVAVAASHRGRGVGRALLERLLDDAGRSGCRQAFLEVRPSNRPARRLYARLGFRRISVRHGYYRDGEDALLMGRTLGSPAGR